VPRDVLSVMETIHKAGSRVWVVGGALRDFLLGIEPKDWDLATDAGTGKIISIFPRVIPVGIRHGTVQVHTRTRDIEVTSFAPPGEAGIIKDLGRRDFTINSLALSYPAGVLIDPNGGRKDLDSGLIRAVGNPSARFSDDPLRIVRAARMLAIYGFRIDPSTFDAMRQLAAGLENVSGERIRDEVLKILQAGDTLAAFDLLKNTGALDMVLPPLSAGARIEFRKGTGVSIYDHTLCCIVNCPGRERIRLAALFHMPACSTVGDAPTQDFPGKSASVARETMRAWNMSNRSIDDVSTLVLNQLSPQALSWSDVRIRRFIIGVRPELLDDFTALAEAEILCAGNARLSVKTPVGERIDPGLWTEHADWTRHDAAQQSRIEEVRQLRARMQKQLERISAMSVRELALSGGDVMEMLDLPPGPQVGKVLNQLFEMVLEDPALNTRERLTRAVETAIKSKNL
jgi:tRNA nucleotidyltransferase/poly(A) polymerase